MGCGNPIAVAELRQGEKVLDLGSGGGIDVLPRRVGETGFAYGVDMTDEMLDLARANAVSWTVCGGRSSCTAPTWSGPSFGCGPLSGRSRRRPGR